VESRLAVPRKGGGVFLRECFKTKACHARDAGRQPVRVERTRFVVIARSEATKQSIAQ